MFNSIPSSCVRVATPISEMSWTSHGPFHDFSILDPFLDDFLALKSKTLSQGGLKSITDLRESVISTVKKNVTESQEKQKKTICKEKKSGLDF
jgi:hypothetical protein